jgi:hypothetical protein
MVFTPLGGEYVGYGGVGEARKTYIQSREKMWNPLLWAGVILLLPAVGACLIASRYQRKCLKASLKSKYDDL